jgi:hypothetical protein
MTMTKIGEAAIAAVAVGSAIRKAIRGRPESVGKMTIVAAGTVRIAATTTMTVAAAVPTAVAAGSAIRRAIPAPLVRAATMTTMTVAARAAAAGVRGPAKTTMTAAAGTAILAVTPRRHAVAGRIAAEALSVRLEGWWERGSSTAGRSSFESTEFQ